MYADNKPQKTVLGKGLKLPWATGDVHGSTASMGAGGVVLSWYCN